MYNLNVQKIQRQQEFETVSVTLFYRARIQNSETRPIFSENTINMPCSLSDISCSSLTNTLDCVFFP